MADVATSRYAREMRTLALANNADSLLTAPILRDLVSGTDSLRMAALGLLRDAGPAHPQVFPALIDILNHGVEEERLRVPWILAGMVDSLPGLAIPALRRALTDGNPELRAVAGSAVGGRRLTALTELMLTQLEDPDPGVRLHRVKQMMYLDWGRTDYFDRVALLFDDPAPDVRAAVLETILRKDPEKAHPYWIAAWSDVSGVVRVAFLRQASRYITKNECWKLWTASLGDPDPEVRGTAFRWLHTPSSERWRQSLLAEAASDSDAGIRVWGLQSLDRTLPSDGTAEDIASRALEDSKAVVRLAAAQKLEAWGALPLAWDEQTTRDLMMEVFVTADDCILRVEAYSALMDRLPPGEELLRVLAIGLEDPEPWIRVRVLISLNSQYWFSWRPYAETRALALSLTEDEDQWVRVYAWEICQRLEQSALARLTGD